MRRFFTLLALLFLLVVLAQEQTDTASGQTTEEGAEQSTEEKRIIRIDYSGGTEDGDFRFGPLTYTHPDPEGIVGTVSNLTIYSQNAVLTGPEGEDVPLADAEGRRNATFSGGLRVTRNRLEAKGPDLSYSEETGIGSMTGNVAIVVQPKEDDPDGNPVTIMAEAADFDVDTDVSISKGNVQLENGNQSATSEQVIYEETRELGKLTSEGGQATITRTDDDGGITTITADVIYALTKTKQLHAIGNVRVEDGSITSTGDEVFFDDEKSRAEVIGSPARAEDEDTGDITSGPRIEQRTDIDAVSIYTSPSEFNADDFVLTSEQQN
jgi:lipopolysaccharide transport protein LptA